MLPVGWIGVHLIIYLPPATIEKSFRLFGTSIKLVYHAPNIYFFKTSVVTPIIIEQPSPLKLDQAISPGADSEN